MAAVRREDLALFRRMYDVAIALGYLDAHTSDQWLRFLTAVHHCATARLTRGRIARLITFNNAGLDVSRCSQRSDDWAGRMLARQWRAPDLAGRLCESGNYDQ